RPGLQSLRAAGDACEPLRPHRTRRARADGTRRAVNVNLLALVLPGLLACAAPTSVSADAWPQGTVRFIVPLGPGSAADAGARLLAERLTARWGKPVVVENRPGGDAVIGIAAFVGANDDHTLLYAPSGTFTIQPFAHDKLPYDARRDILPIAPLSNTIA